MEHLLLGFSPLLIGALSIWKLGYTQQLCRVMFQSPILSGRCLFAWNSMTSGESISNDRFQSFLSGRCLLGQTSGLGIA